MDFGSSEGGLWLKHVPLPRLLDVLINVVRDGGDGGVSEEILEDLMPELCFALPRDARGCVELLGKLPEESKVWAKLEEGLKRNRCLPVEITLALYTKRITALENEVIRVLSLYADSVYDSDWREKSMFTIQRFKSKNKSATGVISSQSTSTQMDKYFWVASPVVSASAISPYIFSVCLSLLYKTVQGSYSINSIFASSDYISRVFSIVHCDLYTLFPSRIQHLVYLLTLPLTSKHDEGFFQIDANITLVEEALTEAVNNGVDIDTVRVLLCFFPFWLPVLEKKKILKKHLQDWWCQL